MGRLRKLFTEFEKFLPTESCPGAIAQRDMDFNQLYGEIVTLKQI
jgi:hypothetical protein